MNYTLEIEIDKPIDKVIEIFDNPENMDKWMDGLQSFKHLSGTPGQPGAKSELKFKMGKREIDMTETILIRNLPYEFTGSYQAKGVFNIVKNKFTSLPGARTKYTTEQEFRFTGYMKIIGLLMPAVFKKQSMKYLKDFKKYVEKN
ncbi:MAG: SRPBCC family protein [Bacteroidota bacterium]|nr:SRPBCC family protein [Bacteroidota bacterium]